MKKASLKTMKICTKVFELNIFFWCYAEATCPWSKCRKEGGNEMSQMRIHKF